MRKTALLTGVAGLLLMTTPALAQDGMAAQPQDQPAAATAAAPAAEQPQTLTLQPGSDVKGSDGAVLGQLEGARNSATGQELTVRGSDGALRAVPVTAGVRQDGEGVAVGWTSAQFSAAPSITDATEDTAEPAASPMTDDSAMSDEPAMSDETGMAPRTPPTLPEPTEPSDPAPDMDSPAAPASPGT
jgi:hypothetical protein